MTVETSIFTRLTTDATVGGLISTHGLTTTDAVTLATTVADLPAPLVVATTYYARAVSSTTISLHPTAADATGDTNKIDITDAGTGTHTCIPTSRPREWFTFTADAGTDILTSTRYRLTPQIMARESLLPAMTYQRIATPRVRSLAGPSGLAHPRFQLNCWATTYAGAKTLSEAVRSRVDGYSGVIGSDVIGDINLEDDGDMFDAGVETETFRRYGIRLDIIVWHEE